MKGCNITEATKILLLAASTIITCILVAIGMNTMRVAKNISGSALSYMSDINRDLEYSEIKMYDGTELYGSEVINIIKKNLGGYQNGEQAPLYILIKTRTSENTYTNGDDLDHIRDYFDEKYIKPTSLFLSEIVQNENEVIIGIKFIQK